MLCDPYLERCNASANSFNACNVARVRGDSGPNFC